MDPLMQFKNGNLVMRAKSFAVHRDALTEAQSQASRFEEVSAARIVMTAIRLTAVLGLLLIGPVAERASAAGEEIDKGKFKEGCEKGHGSYIENADGSFQCNTSGGGTVKCPDTKSQCTYTEKISPAGIVEITVHLAGRGAMELLNPPSEKPGKPTQKSD